MRQSKPFSGNSIDMVTGPLLKNLLLFSLPLMATNILQLLFNAADVVVVGRYASYASLAAVGSTTAIVNLVVNLLFGISVGVNVLIARFLGAGDRADEISAAVHTAVALALIGGIVLGGVGCVAAEWILRVVSTPEDIFDLALTYLYIYFAGTPAIMLYNYGAAALRARGDTRRPLIFLTISGVVNVALNLFFVIACRMDVAGVALATVISESLSAVLILICLMRTDDELHFSWRQLRIDRRSLIRMSKIGIPAGIQSCLFSLSNVAIQSAINAYGSVVIAGCSAASSIEGFYLRRHELVSSGGADLYEPEYRRRKIRPHPGHFEEMYSVHGRDRCGTERPYTAPQSAASAYLQRRPRRYCRRRCAFIYGGDTLFHFRYRRCTYRRDPGLRQSGGSRSHQSAVHLCAAPFVGGRDRYKYHAHQSCLCILSRFVDPAAHRTDILLASPVSEADIA